jgi:cell filamentation protein
MASKNEILENAIVRRRVLELLENPIQGNFDVRHIRETHRYIFQDLPKAGLWNYNVQPGEFRIATKIWCKDRVLSGIDGADGKKPDVSFTTYSRMDGKAIEKLDVVLKDAKPENFKGLDKKSFVEKISILYSDLDYLHPFREGNSRTLRTFTDQLARDSGYELNWERMNDRDLLYIARDRELAEHAGKDEDQEPFCLAQARYDMDRHRNYPGMAQLLEKTIERTHRPDSPVDRVCDMESDASDGYGMAP